LGLPYRNKGLPSGHIFDGTQNFCAILSCRGDIGYCPTKLHCPLIASKGAGYFLTELYYANVSFTGLLLKGTIKLYMNASAAA